MQLVFLGVLRCILQSQFADLRLAFGTGFPAFFRTFVSSDVNIGRREDIHDFIEHILGELQGLFIPAAQHVGEDSELSCHFIRTSGTAQLRIRSEGSQHVSRHIYFGDDGDIAFGCISDDFLGFFLGVISADRSIVELI